MFSCRELLAELSNLVDDDVSPEVRRQIEHHIAECSTCEILFDTMKKTLVVVTEAGALELPERLASGIRSRVMDEIRSRGAHPVGRPME